MNQLVYLPELDSVRSSPEEIRIGQWAVFEEIVLRQNCVVLSFNQITDSWAFLTAIQDPVSAPRIRELFELGVIRVGQFKRADGTVYTASQYIQKHLAESSDKNKGKEKFIFSAVPVDWEEEPLKSQLAKALKYAYPEMIQAPDVEQFRLRYLKLYVKTILQQSLSPRSINPPLGNTVPFRVMLQEVLRNIQDCESQFRKYRGEEAWQLVIPAAGCLNSLIPLCGNARSDYLDALIELSKNADDEKRKQIRFADAIVDLCYNFTVEASMNGVLKHYKGDYWQKGWEDSGKEGKEEFMKGFMDVFVKDLCSYWNNGGLHPFCRKPPHSLPEPCGSLPPWDSAVRMCREYQRAEQKRKNQRSYSTIPQNRKQAETYEEELRGSRNRRIRRTVWVVVHRLSWIAAYVLGFCLLNLVMNLLQEAFSVEQGVSPGELGRYILCNCLALAVALGIISTLAAQKLHIPDVLESFQSLGHLMKDIIIAKWRVHRVHQWKRRRFLCRQDSVTVRPGSGTES